LSTAAHNFQDVPNGGRFRLFSASSSTETPLTALAWNHGNYGKPGTLDAAWLEIDRQSASENKLAGVSLDRVDPYHESDPDRIEYEVVGFPIELHTLERTETRNLYRATPIVYNTHLGRGAKLGDDELLLDYSGTAETDDGTVKLPYPGGMSGGGIWSVPIFEDEEIWSAAKFNVVGITTHYLPSSGQLRGSRMHHWLRLVHDDVPELREHIAPLLTG
jgi:hypothetical protein